MRSSLLLVAFLVSTRSFADEQPQMSIASGAWASAELVDGMTVEGCLAVGDSGKLAFRADEQTIEIRTSNADWSLSADTVGDMTVTVGSYQHSFSMHALNGIMLTGVVTANDVSPLLNAMDKAPLASLKFGTKTVISLSLIGSTRVLNDWRACVGTNGYGDLGKSTGKVTTPF